MTEHDKQDRYDIEDIGFSYNWQGQPYNGTMKHPRESFYLELSVMEEIGKRTYALDYNIANTEKIQEVALHLKEKDVNSIYWWFLMNGDDSFKHSVPIEDIISNKVKFRTPRR